VQDYAAAIYNMLLAAWGWDLRVLVEGPSRTRTGSAGKGGRAGLRRTMSSSAFAAGIPAKRSGRPR
jgi:cytolysin (calcineurin-like family phosphatase)